MTLLKSATVAAGLAAASCTGMSDTQQRTMTGAVGGAAGGALIGAIAGDAALGAGIGVVAGAAGGYLWDQHKKSEERAYRSGYQAGQSDN